MAAMRLVAPLLATSILLAPFAARADATAAEAEPQSKPPLYTWVGFGVGGAGLLVGTLFGVDAQQAASTAREKCAGNRCPPSSFNFLDQANTSAFISTAAFGVAAIGIGIGIYGLASGTPRDEKPLAMPGPELSLRVSPTGLALSGAF